MKLTDEEKFQKNAEILRQQWKNELNDTLIEVEHLIREDFYSGIWGLLFNRIVGFVYSFLLSKDIKEKIIRQMEVLLDASREYDGNIEEIVERFFELYLLEDASWDRAKKNHSKTPELKERYKRSFITLVKETNTILHAEGNNYDELYVNAYKTEEEACRSTFCIIDNAIEDLEFAIEHNMIKINRLVRDPIIRILRREIEIGREYYEKKITELFCID